MKNNTTERPALLIIDMVKDNFIEEKNLPITPFARMIIPPVNAVSSIFREHGWPVVFSTDSFNKDDFIFKGKMKPHSLSGTEGAEIIEELHRKEEDYWLPKPRFSAFFKTGLDKWLRQREVTLCAVAGIATNFCVLTTVIDAVCHDFKSVLLEDCTAASSEKIHEQTLNTYRFNPLYPLLRFISSSELLKELS